MKIKWMLRNPNEQFFGDGLRVVESSTEATQFNSEGEAVASCQALFGHFGESFSPIRMVAREVGRHTLWDLARCDECAKNPSTFSDPTHDSSIGPPEWLCAGCAKHRIEMAIMALSAARQ